MNSICKLEHLSISILSVLMYRSLALDRSFQDCEPRVCGSNTITYPFYILGLQKSFCGHPGFEVTCNSKDQTLINLSNDTYAIQEILYEKKSMHIINTAFTDLFNCTPAIHNFTLDEKRFRYASYSEAFLLQDCTEDFKRNIVQYKQASCISGNVSTNLITINAQHMNWSEVAGKCKKDISVPYEGKNVINGDIDDAVRMGFELRWVASNCSECAESGGRCEYLKETSSQMQCFCPHGAYPRACPKKRPGLVRLIVAIGSSIGAVVLIALVIIYAKRKHRTKRFTTLWTKGTTRNQNVEAFLKSYGSLAPKRYTYAEIRKVTNNFKDKLGEGGYGAVYKGKLLDNRFVAVKKLKKLKGDGEEFINEIISIGRTNHVNVVTLLGFCFEGNKRALVYEFMPNGSLEKFINSAANGQSLPSETLFSIAVGIAKGLHYLHSGCNARILHFDIKPHNILLDEELRPKISDFGLARLCPAKDSVVSMSKARGTIGYIAPEVFCRNFGGVSHKSDVYSYGMMLLDMVCDGNNVIAEAQSSREMYFPDWIYRQLEQRVEIEGDGLMNGEAIELQRKMVLVGLWCIQSLPSNRPPMNRVIEMLEAPVESLQVPPMPHLSSPLNSTTPALSTES